MRRPFLHSLAWSFLVVFSLMVGSVFVFNDWPSAWFIILLMSPCILMIVGFWGVRDTKADFFRNQTYFNIDQTRRNTDKMVK